ncbi:unnamed protein product [Chrysodeixis includens]|uniref:MADF domain-containing protein n=1 Tax=Chrysodeixis includens TaxID=689277 RepID=A0A9P0FUS3_CHRIL|nr:unnamed protein product [Chrysodeixis includens]
MREFKYDVIQLIHCVRDRPCLWDKTIENYKDRVERRCAWKEIFCILDESYEEMTPEEKRFTEETILNKWTNVRDTFMKTLKTRLGRPKRKYLLYNHIQFLTKIVPEEERHASYNNEENDVFMKQENETESSFPVEESSFSQKRSKPSEFNDENATSDYSAGESSFSSPKRKSKKNTRETNNSKELTKKKARKVTAKDDSEKLSLDNDNTNDIDFVEVADNDPRIMNEDEAFFAALLPSIVKYTEDERLEFRIEVLGVMKRIKEKREWAE